MSIMVCWLVGACLVLCAGLIVYLTAYQQMIRARRLPLRVGIAGGCLLGMTALAAFCMAAGPLAGFFVTCVGFMLVFSLLPLGIALYRFRTVRS